MSTAPSPLVSPAPMILSKICHPEPTLNGRRGVAIGRVEEASHLRQDIIIDPGTGLLIGERQVLTQSEGNMPAGTAKTLTTIETSVTDSAP